ncbi:hypothetical protein ElyMa_007025900 [Elysia marginata]|uniref:Uncharacterized protein n=1 Tax=Elysia marginata TaxID=1093978 RepID=A0AAV4JSV6_9GAST|nr:hypothetical protein ElyMa_007025900 [Elysia marginata]
MASRRHEEDPAVLEPLNPTSGDDAAGGPVGRFAVKKVDDSVSSPPADGAGAQPDLDVELGKVEQLPEDNDGVGNGGNRRDPEIEGFVNAKGKTGFFNRSPLTQSVRYTLTKHFTPLYQTKRNWRDGVPNISIREQRRQNSNPYPFCLG